MERNDQTPRSYPLKLMVVLAHPTGESMGMGAIRQYSLVHTNPGLETDLFAGIR